MAPRTLCGLTSLLNRLLNDSTFRGGALLDFGYCLTPRHHGGFRFKMQQLGSGRDSPPESHYGQAHIFATHGYRPPPTRANLQRRSHRFNRRRLAGP